MTANRVLVCALTVFAYASTSQAQESRPFVGGMFSVSRLKLGTIGSGGSGYRNTSTDTWLRGVTFEAGAQITSRLSVGVEFTPPSQEVRFDQDYGYGQTYYKAMIRYREAVLVGVARLNFPQVPYVQLALVGGGGRVLGRATGRTALGLRFPASGYAPFGDEWETTGGSFAVVVGGDIGFPVHRHLEIVTQGRLLFIDRGDVANGGAFYSFGLFDKVTRGGVGARVRF